MEKWKDIAGFEGIYQVSTEGRVRSLPREYTFMRQGKEVTRIKKGFLLKCSLGSSGYLQLLISKENKKKLVRVHRLVAETFIHRTDETLEVNHVDGNKKNNVVENLEWVTHKENAEHASVSGLYKSGSKRTEVLKELAANQSATNREVAEKTGANIEYVYRLRKKHIQSNIYE